MSAIEFEMPRQYGWICPKCGRVNSPYTTTCPCYKQSDYKTSTVLLNRVGGENKVERGDGFTYTTADYHSESDYNDYKPKKN